MSRPKRIDLRGLTAERYSRASTAAWWPTPPRHCDNDQMQYYRRLELEAIDNDEEASDGSVEETPL